VADYSWLAGHPTSRLERFPGSTLLPARKQALAADLDQLNGGLGVDRLRDQQQISFAQP